MKKSLLVISLFIFGIVLLAQDLQHDAIAINIEVPVRVFKKGKFVEELCLGDFEVYEDGVLQKIEALYLVKKTVIEREETELDQEPARRIYMPEVSRTFVLVFEMMDYLPGIQDTLAYFFDNVYLPDDSLYVVTPLKTYALKKENLNRTPKEIMVEQLQKKLAKDIRLSSNKLKSLFRDLENLANDPSGATESLIHNTLREIRDYRSFDERKLMEFKDRLKDIEGQKFVFLFFQKKVVPIPPGIGEYDDLDDLIRAQISFNVDKVKKAFSDSLISIQFIFVTKTDQYNLDGYRMNPAPQGFALRLVDQSEEIFGAFHEMADATGGITDSSANITSSFQRAALASENYYLLYYTPKNYKSDGKFKNIQVKIKGKNYKIAHRAGYIAD